MFNSETAKLAGSKSKRGASERTKVLNELFDSDKAKAIYQKLETEALAGNIRAIEIYLAYSFGKPEAKIDITTDGESLNNVSKLTTEQLYQLKQMKAALEN